MTLGQDLSNIEEDRQLPYKTVFLDVSWIQLNDMDQWCQSSIGLHGPNWHRTSTYRNSLRSLSTYNAIYYFDTTEHKFQFDLVWPN